MKTALETLGLNKVYHLGYDDTEDDFAFWTAALEAKYQNKGSPFGQEEWDYVFWDCDAVPYLPLLLFIPELLEVYPEAQILLTTGSLEEWHRSMMETVCSPVYKTFYHRFPALFNAVERKLGVVSDLCEKIAWDSDFERFGMTYGATHEELVRQLGKTREKECESRGKTKLAFVELQVGEGWERLCAILEVQVPESPYPKGNNVVEFRREADEHAFNQWVHLGTRAVIVVGLLFVVTIAW